MHCKPLLNTIDNYVSSEDPIPGTALDAPRIAICVVHPSGGSLAG
jgi:hypothetical protein